MDDFSNTVEYRAVSKAAVAACLLSAAGLLSLISPSLLLIPIVGVLVSLAAIWSVGRSQLAGRGLAVIALAISSFCICSVLMHGAAFEWLLKRQARRHSETYFEVLAEGRLHEAHQLMSSEEDREAEGADLKQFYRFRTDQEVAEEAGLEKVQRNPLQELERTFNAPPLREVTAALQDGDQATFVRAAQVTYDEYSQLVYSVFRLEQAELEFAIGMRRYRDMKTKETSWQVRSVTPKLD